MPQKPGSKLPDRGEWVISNAITGKNAPFAWFAVTFAQNSAGRASGTCTYWKTTAPLGSITETDVDTFLANYTINGEHGSFEAKYDPVHQTFELKFLGRKTQVWSDGDTFTARPTSIELNSRSVASWTPEERLQEAVRRALPLMPSDVAEEVGAMLTPKAIAFMGTVTLIWGAAQLYGGPAALVADILMLIVGVGALGMQVYDVAEDIVDFAAARNAQSDPELDKAAAGLAKAISIVGVNTIAIILFAKAPKVLNEPYKPRSMPVRGRPIVEPTVTPAAEIGRAHGRMRLDIARRTGKFGWLLDTTEIQVDLNAELPPGVHGTTDIATGQIRISRTLTGNAQARAIRHEKVHQFITRLASISEITLDLRVWAYEKSYLVRYLEEAIAELAASTAGGDGMLAAFHFPIKNGYIEVRNASSRLARGVARGITEQGINYETWKLQLRELNAKISASEKNGGRFLNQTELSRFYGQKAELEGLLKPFDELLSGFIRIKGNGLRLKSYGRADPMLNEAAGMLLGELNVFGNAYRVFFSHGRPESSDPIPFEEATPAAFPR